MNSRLASILAPALLCAAGSTQSPTSPLRFVENRGQWPQSVHYFATRGPLSAWLQSDSLVLRALTGVDDGPEQLAQQQGQFGAGGGPLHGATVRIAFEHGGSEPTAHDALPGLHNYYLDSREGLGARAYRHVTFPNVWPGIDIALRDDDVFFAYDLRLLACARLTSAVFRCEGADGMYVDADGNLVMQTAVGDLVQTAPVGWHVRTDGSREPAKVRFRQLDGERFGFELDGPRRNLPLVVDPGIRMATLLGGVLGERAQELERDVLGDTVMTGFTQSPAFPVTIGAHIGERDAYVAKHAPTASGSAPLVFSTVFGGANEEIGADVHAAPLLGPIWACGLTNSPGFPTMGNPLGGAAASLADAQGYLIELDPMTGTIICGSLFGGSDHDWFSAIERDDSGTLVLAGYTNSFDLPVTAGAPQTVYGGGTDAFVARIDPDCGATNPVQWSTFWGGSAREGWGFPTTSDRSNLLTCDVALDGSKVALTARTRSTNVPVTPGCFQPAHANPANGDLLVAVFDPSQSPGSQLDYATYIGGGADEGANVITRHPHGGYVLGCYTWSGTFPITPGSISPTKCLSHDGGLFWLRPDGNGLADRVWASFLSGDAADAAHDVKIERSGIWTVCGWSKFVQQGCPFPTTPWALQPTPGPDALGFVMRILPRGANTAELHYATMLDGHAVLRSLELTATAEVLVAGTGNTAFSSTTGIGNSGGNDVSLTWLDPQPTGVDRTGPSTSCSGEAIYTGADSWPQAGNAGFALHFANAPNNAFTMLLFGMPHPGFPLFNTTILIDPFSVVTLLITPTDAHGFVEQALPLPATLPVGAQFHLQGLFLKPGSCALTSDFSTSQRLDLTIQ